MTAAPEPVRLDRLPMAEDRTAAYSFLRAAGPVLRTTWRSAAGRTAASDRTWPGWKCGWRSRSGTAGYRTTSWHRGPRRG
jgi:hypothetical protein